MAKLPWSDNKNVNINTPCRLCSEEAISATGSKYCLSCYRELLTLVILRDYPVSGKEVMDKLYKNDPENKPS